MQTTTYLTIEPTYSNYRNSAGGHDVRRIEVVKATHKRPRTTPPHSVVVEVVLDLPSAAFQPLQPAVAVTVPEEALITGDQITVVAVPS